MVQPATPFWEGYKRDPKVTADLVSALANALYAHPELRLGQLVMNLTEDPFNCYDESMIAQLRGMA